MKRLLLAILLASSSAALAGAGFGGGVASQLIDGSGDPVTVVDGNLGVSVEKSIMPRAVFGSALVVQLTPIIQGTFEYTVDNEELTINVVTNGGTVTQALGMAFVGTSTTTASHACLKSKRAARYRSGQGGLIRFTALFSAPVAGTEMLIGLADEVGSVAAFKNGYTIGYIGDTFGFHRFQNDAVISVSQSAFDDPLDGTGESGMTLDLTKGSVWQIEFQYLGFGAIVLSVEDDATGDFIEVHRDLYSNNHITPSVHNPNFKFTMWADNKGTTSNMVLQAASYGYFIEGKTRYQQIHQPQQTTSELQKTGVTTEVAIFTIRNKSLYAAKANFIELLLEYVSVSLEASSANNLGSVRLVRNATLGGSPSYSDINTSDSVVEIDTAGTTVTGGKTLFTVPLAGKNDKGAIDLTSFEIILAPGETITLAGSSAASATINASTLWKELF